MPGVSTNADGAWCAVHRELDYQSHMTIEKGLQEMREAHDQRDRVHQSR